MVRDQGRNNIADVTSKLTTLKQNKKIISISLCPGIEHTEGTQYVFGGKVSTWKGHPHL